VTLSDRVSQRSQRAGGRVICPASAIESLNDRYRRPIKARGHFAITFSDRFPAAETY
jgi:transposase-like protein